MKRWRDEIGRRGGGAEEIFSSGIGEGSGGRGRYEEGRKREMGRRKGGKIMEGIGGKCLGGEDVVGKYSAGRGRDREEKWEVGEIW